MNITQITTKDILKALPFEEKLKVDLLQSFDSFTPSQKFELEQIIENAYYGLYQSKLQDNIDSALKRAENNQEELGPDFYKRIREQTEKEMQEDLTKASQNVDLSAARAAMEKIVQEMKAAKKN